MFFLVNNIFYLFFFAEILGKIMFLAAANITYLLYNSMYYSIIVLFNKMRN